MLEWFWYWQVWRYVSQKNYEFILKDKFSEQNFPRSESLKIKYTFRKHTGGFKVRT